MKQLYKRKGKKLSIRSKIIFHLLVFTVISIIYFKQSDEIARFKEQLFYYMKYTRVDNQVDITEYPPIQHTGDEWYQDARLISHAGGRIDRSDYSNSKEALEETLKKGIYFVEIDFMYTSDQKLVCMHKWEDQWGPENVPSLQEFLSEKIFGKYTPMTAADVVEYMENYPELYVIIDTKEEDQVQVVKTLIDLSAHNPDITDRFVIQLYAEGVKSEIQKLYPFQDSNYLFTIYKYGDRMPRSVMKICYDENISVVTIPYSAWKEEDRQIFYSRDFKVYEHTVNCPDDANEAIEEGVWGVYTDLLSYDDLYLTDENDI